MYAVGERLTAGGRDRAGALWAVLPHSLVLTMAYTEPLLTAFAAWALYALLRGRWGWAGGLAVLAGLTRPTGIAVAAAVVGCAAAPELPRDGAAAARAVWAAALAAPRAGPRTSLLGRRPPGRSARRLLRRPERLGLALRLRRGGAALRPARC